MRRIWVWAAVLWVLGFPAALAAEPATEGAAVPEWMKRIRLTGTLEGDFTWSEHEDIADLEAGSASDLFLSTVELGVEADFNDFITGFILFLAEDLGTADETSVTVDEATFTLQSEGFPLYLTVGKRVQPFGVFENHLLSDPMTQDAYETNRVGATLGYHGPLDVDVSFTLYRGEEQIEHLFESDLFDTETVARRAGESDDVESFIVAASVTPVQNHLLYLTVFAAYLSEPGRGQRNETVNLGVNFIPPFFKNLKLDAEYMKALNRERYEGFDREFHEAVLSVTVAYEFVIRRKELLGGGLFAERKAHIVTEPMELAFRYEHFDDDGLAWEAQAWSVQNRYGVSGRYTFYENHGLAAYLGVEYRRSTLRVHPSRAASVADENDEVLARLGVTF